MIVTGIAFLLYAVLIYFFKMPPEAAACVVGLAFVALALLIGDRVAFTHR